MKVDGISAKKLARQTGLSLESLFDHLKRIGIQTNNENDLISGKDQLKLLRSLSAKNESQQLSKEVTIKDIEATNELEELNQFLTRAMIEHKHNELIKDDNLESIVRKVLELNIDTNNELQTAAILGRIAAVARGRESVVFDRADEIFSKEPESIESLDDKDAKTKNYAASIISHCNNSWAKDYSYREAYEIDRANAARRVLLAANLEREENLEDWLNELVGHASVLRKVSKPETRYRRVKELTSVLAELTKTWRGDLGENPGEKLSFLMKSMFGYGHSEADFSNVVEGLDYLLSILQRCIELRFSMALYPDLYAILVDGKQTLATGLWGRYLEQSDKVSEVRHSLLESSLVLARQDRFDNDMMDVLRAAFSSRTRMTSAIKKYFADAKDLDSTVADWWRKGGGGEGDKEQKAQRIRNSEDEKIGELLLKVEESRSVMEKLSSAVLPILQPLNPVLAETVAKAAKDYKETALVVRSLSRMRQLQPAGLMSERMEYNRRSHDMEGGHRSGIRRVRVIRDGVEKTFAGKTRMIVNPIVVREE